MIKKILSIAAIVLTFASVASPDPQNGFIATISAGTAVRLISNPSKANPVMANSLFIEPLHGGTGLVYVLYAPPDVTCTNGGAGTTFVAELAPATSTAPGQSFTFPSNGTAAAEASGTDIRSWCIDGSHTGDTVAVSWNLRN